MRFSRSAYAVDRIIKRVDSPINSTLDTAYFLIIFIIDTIMLMLLQKVYN